MMKKTLFILLTFFTAATAQAHSVWINAFESHAHKPPHVMVSLGWGHFLPMDDILNSPNGRVDLDSFEIVDPARNRTALALPALQEAKADKSARDFDVFPGDLAVRKIAFRSDSAPGVYQISATTRPTFYTRYVDTKGKERMQLVPRDEIKDLDKALMSVKFQAFAKSCVAVGKWIRPEPLGHDLEIIPRTDLSDLRAGDLVEVDVLFHGKPLTATARSIEYITAHGVGFGQSDGFALFSYIMDGKARFRVQSAGQWMISVNHKDDVTPDGPLKDLMGRADQVYHSASLTFTVK